MDSMQDSFASLRSMFMDGIASFESRLEKAASAPTFTDGQNLTADFNLFKAFTLKSLNLMQRQMEQLAKQMDTIEMRGRRKTLLLHGVAEHKPEDTAALISKTVQQHLQLDSFTVPDIKRCHRMGRPSSEHKPRPILVKFHSVELRDKIWFLKAKLKGTGVTLSEFLTKPRHDAFMAARERYGISKCWTREGSVHIIGTDGSRYRVSSLEELNNIPSQDAVKQTEPSHIMAGSGAFLRILCVCCPRKLRRKYQPQLRFNKQSQYPVSTMMYSSVSQHEMCRL